MSDTDSVSGSFFDQLHNGLTTIDTKVNALKQLAARDFVDLEMERSAGGGYNELRNFENDIRSMHRQVMDLKKQVFERPTELDSVEHKLQSLSIHLSDFVTKHQLQRWGYVPWVNSRPAEEPELLSASSDDPQSETIRAEVVPEAVSLPDAVIQMAKEPEPRRRTPVPKKRLIPTPKSVAFREEEDRKRKDPRSRHKLDLNFPNTPRASFRPVAAKRFTILPPGLTLCASAKPVDDKQEEMKAPLPTKDLTPEKGPNNNEFGGNDTTRFNLPILMQSYNMSTAPETPSQMASDSVVNEHETIEFTPGLTTRRPVAVRRCKEATAAPVNQKVSAVTNSFKSLSIVGTPTQPIPSQKLIQSVKAVKSHGKMKQVGDKLVPATPQMPVSSINPEIFKYFLRSKK